DVRSAPTDAAPIIDRLPVAAPLAIQERQGDWLRISYDGWIAFRDTVDIAQLAARFPVPGDLLRTAECFLGVSYLWGGTTAVERATLTPARNVRAIRRYLPDDV